MEQHPWDAVGAGELHQSSAQCQHLRESGLRWTCDRDFSKSHPSPGVPLLTWGLVTLLGTLDPVSYTCSEFAL